MYYEPSTDINLCLCIVSLVRFPMSRPLTWIFVFVLSPLFIVLWTVHWHESLSLYCLSCSLYYEPSTDMNLCPCIVCLVHCTMNRPLTWISVLVLSPLFIVLWAFHWHKSLSLYCRLCSLYYEPSTGMNICPCIISLVHCTMNRPLTWISVLVLSALFIVLWTVPWHEYLSLYCLPCSLYCEPSTDINLCPCIFSLVHCTMIRPLTWISVLVLSPLFIVLWTVHWHAYLSLYFLPCSLYYEPSTDINLCLFIVSLVHCTMNRPLTWISFFLLSPLFIVLWTVHWHKSLSLYCLPCSFSYEPSTDINLCPCIVCLVHCTMNRPLTWISVLVLSPLFIVLWTVHWHKSLSLYFLSCSLYYDPSTYMNIFLFIVALVHCTMNRPLT